MTTATKKRCTCIECEISFGIRPPGTFSPVTCEECTSHLKLSRLCERCQRIIVVGECYLRDEWLGDHCWICADGKLRQVAIKQEDYYRALGNYDDYRPIYEINRLMDAMRCREWSKCRSIAKELEELGLIELEVA